MFKIEPKSNKKIKNQIRIEISRILMLKIVTGPNCEKVISHRPTIFLTKLFILRLYPYLI